MRVTIIPNDGFVSVDGLGFAHLNLFFIPPNVHAVQWYGTYGEIEFKNPVTSRMTENRTIESLNEFQAAVAAWQTEKDKRTAAMVALEEASKNPIGGEPDALA